MQETWVQSLGWEDPLEKEMATHSSILSWKIPWTEEPGRLQNTGSQRVGHDRATEYTHIYTHTHPARNSFSYWITALMHTSFLPGLQHWCACAHTHSTPPKKPLFLLDYSTDAHVHTHTAPPTRNPFSYWITALMQLFLSVASAQHPVKLSRSSFPPLSLQ